MSSEQDPIDAIDLPVDPSAETLDAVRSSIESNGYAVVQPPDDSAESLLFVAGLLGNIQNHIRSDGTGVCPTSAEGHGVDASQKWTQHRVEYQSYGTGETPAHSDGTFLDGAIADGASLRTVAPPALLILQVVRNAGVGGESFLVDGKQVLLSLLADEPELLKILMAPGCITYCRDDQLALNQPVFRLLASERALFRFRSDSKAFAPDWARAAVERLRDHYCVDGNFRKVLRMTDGQTLIVDNTRVLHGRTAFVNSDRQTGRFLRRIWIEDDELVGHFRNLQNIAPTSRALETYLPYRTIGNPHRSDRRVHARRGIRLAGESAAKLKQLAE